MTRPRFVEDTLLDHTGAATPRKMLSSVRETLTYCRTLRGYLQCGQSIPAS